LIRDIHLEDKPVTWDKIFGTNLPNTADFTLWGNIYKTKVDEITGNKIYHIRLKDSKLIFIVKIISDTENEVKVMSKIKNIISFSPPQSGKGKDTIHNLIDKSTFKRVITSKNQTFIYDKGNIVLKTLDKKTKFLTGIKVSQQMNNKMITMDIETRHILKDNDTVLIPYNI